LPSRSASRDSASRLGPSQRRTILRSTVIDLQQILKNIDSVGNVMDVVDEGAHIEIYVQ